MWVCVRGVLVCVFGIKNKIIIVIPEHKSGNTMKQVFCSLLFGRLFPQLNVMKFLPEGSKYVSCNYQNIEVSIMNILQGRN